MLILTVALAFGLSFLFALGGEDSAIALVPVLYWLGVPFTVAKPTGLMVNTLSMTGDSYSYIRNKRLDFLLGIPIIVTSAVLAPVGAWCTRIIPRDVVMVVFIIFLVFSGIMLLFFRGKKYEGNFRNDRSVAAPAAIGAVAGFLSDLLGVGDGCLCRRLFRHGIHAGPVATGHG